MQDLTNPLSILTDSANKNSVLVGIPEDSQATSSNSGLLGDLALGGDCDLDDSVNAPSSASPENPIPIKSQGLLWVLPLMILQAAPRQLVDIQ